MSKERITFEEAKIRKQELQELGIAWDPQVFDVTDIPETADISDIAAIIGSLKKRRVIEMEQPPDTLMGVMGVAKMLGVSHAHVTRSWKRAVRARQQEKKYHGRIPYPDEFIDGNPAWRPKTIQSIRKGVNL